MDRRPEFSWLPGSKLLPAFPPLQRSWPSTGLAPRSQWRDRARTCTGLPALPIGGTRNRRPQPPLPRQARRPSPHQRIHPGSRRMTGAVAVLGHTVLGRAVRVTLGALLSSAPALVHEGPDRAPDRRGAAIMSTDASRAAEDLRAQPSQTRPGESEAQRGRPQLHRAAQRAPRGPASASRSSSASSWACPSRIGFSRLDTGASDGRVPDHGDAGRVVHRCCLVAPGRLSTAAAVPAAPRRRAWSGSRT